MAGIPPNAIFMNDFSPPGRRRRGVTSMCWSPSPAGLIAWRCFVRCLAAKQQVGGAGKLFVGHVDHSLRGDDSTADADWLAEQCRQLAIPLFIEKAHVGAIAEVRGDGIEEAARATRYEILTRMAETLGARFVALGHHRDDQIETILFRLLRGSGLRGLAGMPATRPLSPSVAAVRPLLNVSRREIESYLQAIGQEFAARRNEPRRRACRAERHSTGVASPNHSSVSARSATAAILRVAEQAAEAQTLIDTLAFGVASALPAKVERSRQRRGGDHHASRRSADGPIAVASERSPSHGVAHGGLA